VTIRKGFLQGESRHFVFVPRKQSSSLIGPRIAYRSMNFLKFRRKEGQPKMTKTIYQTHERQLKDKMEELLNQHRDQGALKVENAADPFDQIQAAVERDLLVGLLNRDARLRDDVRRAFELMENGGYGQCEDCEEAIPPARLNAIPWARCCVSCQELRDRQVNEADIFPEAA
jgi:DnaK suppressor protein